MREDLFNRHNERHQNKQPVRGGSAKQRLKHERFIQQIEVDKNVLEKTENGSNGVQPPLSDISTITSPIYEESPLVKLQRQQSYTYTKPSQNPDANGIISPTATNLISWLFSDDLLSNAKDPLLSPAFFDSPMLLQNLLTPPLPEEEIGLTETKRSEMLTLLPSLEQYENSKLIHLQQYLSNYWKYFHPQYPILHRPSFNASKWRCELLWALVLVGSAYNRALEFAANIAEKLRWCLFQSPNFEPPTSLWVIQSLVLLEIFEKTMSERKAHERAHIHHGSTLQLIRSALIGLDSQGKVTHGRDG